MKVAALWIAKDEEKVLARSIDSLAAVVDELVVVDTGSKDATADIAGAAGARVVPFEWTGDFAAARNFALGQTDADIVFFLDADEWFAPALTMADREAVEAFFSNPANLAGQVQMTNLDRDTGVAIDEIVSIRMLRGRGALHYRGRIHEHAVPAAGGNMVGGAVTGLHLNHDGYSLADMPAKLRRNFELLRAAVEAGDEDEQLHTRNQVHLMREAARLKDYEVAFESLGWLLGHPAALKRYLRDYHSSGYTFAYEAIRLAARFRARASRLQVREQVVENVEKLYTHHPICHVIGLYYRLYLNNNEDTLLNGLEAAMAKAEQLRGGSMIEMDEYLQGNIELFTAAGQAAFLRGNRELAFDYASRALKLTKTRVRPGTLGLLMRCVRGLPAQDIILFINSMVDTEKRSVLESLVGALHYEGQADIYAYYMKKLLDAGWAKKSDFWYLMVVLGKYNEAAETAFLARGDTDAEVVGRALFLAICCAGLKGGPLFEAYRAGLGRYEGLAAYMATGAAPAGDDFALAAENYHLVAFAAGRQVANRLLAAFGGKHRTAWLVKAQYHLGSGLYGSFLAEDRYKPENDDEEVRLLLAELDVLAGEHGRALTEVKVLLANCAPTAGIFNLCAVVAAGAEDAPVREEAAQLVEKIRPLYEEMVDWQDVAATNWLPGEDSKKERKALGQLTVAQFDRAVQLRSYQPLVGQLKAAQAATGPLLEGGRLQAALAALQRQLEYGAGSAGVWRQLGDLFEAAGNPPLAGAMRQRVVG